MVPGTWKTKANVWNDYEVDRLGQKTYLYSGIKTFPLQDIAMMENQWGPLAKRELEHLVAMDYQIIHLRQKFLRAAKNMADGIDPPEPFKPGALPLPQRLGPHRERRLRSRRRQGQGARQDQPHSIRNAGTQNRSHRLVAFVRRRKEAGRHARPLCLTGFIEARRDESRS